MIKKIIKNDILKAFKKLKLESDSDFTVEVPNHKEHGDYSSNAALLNCKANRMNPGDLATELADFLSSSKHFVKVDTAYPGFINFTVSGELYHHALAEVAEEEDGFGASEYGQNKKILLEFISANPTGPLNIVSARAAAYGDVLARVMDEVGFDSQREFYINDAGNQVDILTESIELRYRELHGENIGEFPMEAYHGDYIKELAQSINSENGSKLLHLAESERLNKIKEFALKSIHEMHEKSLVSFGVVFDNWVSEKALRKQGVVEEVLSYLAEAGCTFEKDEAIWFNSSKYGDEKDRVLMKADGSITYFVPDLAYHLTKYQRNFDKMIDVFGPDHHGYIPRMRAAIKALKYDQEKLEIVFLQQVNLYDQGEKVKMSKRAGKIVTMDSLIEQVGRDAARFFFINRKPSAHLNFDMELAKKKSTENPVYYCQYAYARICGVIKNAAAEGMPLEDAGLKHLNKLVEDEELAIIRKILDYPNILIAVAEYREPHRLAEYAYELSSMIHKFYSNNKIINKRSKRQSLARIFMMNVAGNVLKSSFRLMGINAPEEMEHKETKSKRSRKKK
ncbi:MAG: arginine--tRNA ligase [Candidatus Cloacimonadota bacterium]|nr:MAG: arginine--tRNA ligase [Candidatus Cloacimonadota bacterium]